jgi:hypothetical protein
LYIGAGRISEGQTAMTRNQEIEKLLSQVPDRSLTEVIGFLRALASKQSVEHKKVRGNDQDASVARRSFKTIAADAATVRQVLSEDLYGLE